MSDEYDDAGSSELESEAVANSGCLLIASYTAMARSTLPFSRHMSMRRRQEGVERRVDAGRSLDWSSSTWSRTSSLVEQLESLRIAEASSGGGGGAGSDRVLNWGGGSVDGLGSGSVGWGGGGGDEGDESLFLGVLLVGEDSCDGM